jgi:hypothetical protein
VSGAPGTGKSHSVNAAAMDRGSVLIAAQSRHAVDVDAVLVAACRVEELRAVVDAALGTERLAASLARWEPLLPTLRIDVPGAFEPGFDVARAGRLADRSGRWVRWRLRRKLGAGGVSG